MSTSREGNWLQTYSGVKFYPLNPRPEDIRIEDIAHALSQINRWTGHSSQPYSVAQHSVWVAEHLPAPLKLEGLLHDATEAYLNDLATPIKRDSLLSGYRLAEERMRLCIAEVFGLGIEEPPLVRKIDRMALRVEAEFLMQPLHPDWKFEYPSLNETVVPWAPEKAKREFLRLYLRLRANQDRVCGDCKSPVTDGGVALVQAIHLRCHVSCKTCGSISPVLL